MSGPFASPPARYFPVREAPLRMEAGLRPFGTDFGNGPADARFFQIDDRWERYRNARRSVPSGRNGILAGSQDERRAHFTIARWMRAQIRSEHPDLAIPAVNGDDPATSYAALAAVIQEDFTVLRRDREGAPERAIAVFVSFPSGWRPERILGAKFRDIHGPVPGFAEDARQAEAMVATLIERGPYVRFVWTVSADDHLDHHPEEGAREAWSAARGGWLRVERQVTVPFPAEGASLFLIRTYLYPFEQLQPSERTILARALAAMPDEIARYKGLAGASRKIAIARLA